MGPSQTARRATQDRARRQPLIRPDYLKLYKVRTGPDAKPADASAPAPAAPPARTGAAAGTAAGASAGFASGPVLTL